MIVYFSITMRPVMREKENLDLRILELAHGAVRSVNGSLSGRMESEARRIQDYAIGMHWSRNEESGRWLRQYSDETGVLLRDTFRDIFKEHDNALTMAATLAPHGNEEVLDAVVALPLPSFFPETQPILRQANTLTRSVLAYLIAKRSFYAPVRILDNGKALKNLPSQEEQHSPYRNFVSIGGSI
jgi:hypothetical protein